MCRGAHVSMAVTARAVTMAVTARAVTAREPHAPLRSLFGFLDPRYAFRTHCGCPNQILFRSKGLLFTPWVGWSGPGWVKSRLKLFTSPITEDRIHMNLFKIL